MLPTGAADDEYWGAYPGLLDIVPPLPRFSIGAPSQNVIGTAQIEPAGTWVDEPADRNFLPASGGSLFGPSRPPRPPNLLVEDISSEATDVARTALRSFILDANSTAGSSPMRMSLMEAHWTFGHSSYASILGWERAGTLRTDGIILSDHKQVWCERCKGANLKRHASPSVSAHRPTDLLHTMAWDLFGPTRIRGVGNIWYFNVGRDRTSGFGWTSPITYKSQAAGHSIHVTRFEQKQVGAHVMVFQCDGGGEYMGPLLKQFLFEDNGTFMRVSAPYHSNDNGGVERLIGILAALTRVELAGSPLPTSYFPYA